MSYIIFQVVFFCILLYFVFKRNESGVSKLIIAEWIVSSVFTLIYTYFVLEGYVSFNYWPVLYWDICYLIYLFPVLKIDIQNIDVSDKYINYSIKILTFLGVLSLLPLWENLVHLIQNYSDQSSAILEMYEDKMNVTNTKNLITWLSPIGKILHDFVSKFTFSGLLLFFIIATKREYIPKAKLLLFFSFFFNTICYTLNCSGRGGVVEFALVVVVLYILFRKLIILEISKTIQIAVSSGVVGIVMCMVILTVIRTDSHVGNEGEYWLSTSLYLGEGQVNFFENMWNCKASAQGDYCFSFIKSVLGFDTFIDYRERREYWNINIVGYDPVRFYTFIGGWFADLKLFTILFIFILSSLLYKRLKKCNGTFDPITLYMIFIYLDILVMGFSIFNFMVYSKFRSVVTMFVYLYILKILSGDKKTIC